jgi:hypothetical protein
MGPERNHFGGSKRRIAVAAVLALTLCGAGFTLGSASAASRVTKTFSFTGGEQIFQVPAGVTKITVNAVGGKGGTGVPISGGTGVAGLWRGGLGGPRGHARPAAVRQRGRQRERDQRRI